MWFYLGAIGLGLLVWIIYVALTGAQAILTVSILGVISFAVILLGIRRGLARGRRKEIFFACSLIILYGLRGFLRTFLIGLYNFIYDIVIAALNRQGITRINIEAGKWKPDAPASNLIELMIFIGGAVAAYAYTSGKDGPKGRDTFGGILGALSSALFLTYSFLLLSPYLGGVYNTPVLNGTVIRLPDINLPDIQIRSQGTASPFNGWERWLPEALLVLVTFYVIFFVFVKPPTKNGKAGPRLDTRTILGIALLLAIAWRFALLPTV